MSQTLTRTSMERLRRVAESHVGDDRVPGLVSLVACGGEVHVQALGTLAIGGAAVRRDSIFRIASTTKPITAAVTLALVGEGLIDLDGPIDRLLPELADRRVLRRMDGPLHQTVPSARPISARDLRRSRDSSSRLKSSRGWVHAVDDRSDEPLEVLRPSFGTRLA